MADQGRPGLSGLQFGALARSTPTSHEEGLLQWCGVAARAFGVSVPELQLQARLGMVGNLHGDTQFLFLFMLRSASIGQLQLEHFAFDDDKARSVSLPSHSLSLPTPPANPTSRQHI